jgi:hypothetical protein
MYRQGDLLFIKTDEEVRGKEKNDRIVLGSSVTGHDHKISAGKVFVVNRDDFDRWQRGIPNFYVVIPAGGAKLTHNEHKTIPLSEGTYKVIRQREVNGYVID